LAADFDVKLHVGAIGNLSVPDLHIAGTAQYEPAELHAEWAHRFGASRRTMLQLALTYRRWSEFDGFVARTVECPEAAPGCGALPEEPVGLADTLVPRAGFEQGIELGSVELALRAGYFYEASPLPAQSGVANRFDNARHVLTLGYGVRFQTQGHGARLDLAYQHHELVARLHEKLGSVSSDNPGYPAASSDGTVDVVALALEFEL
ncbi:MAG TPA: hypothetical protein VGP93_15645, partial [Polyangiaceae bacterium]|nr:hypothetical protein [Polyangiaceae bacterium]